MNEITSLLSDSTHLFGLICVLAVSVTGFFLGRKWLGRTAGGDNSFSSYPYDSTDPHGRFARSAYKSRIRKNHW